MNRPFELVCRFGSDAAVSGTRRSLLLFGDFLPLPSMGECNVGACWRWGNCQSQSGWCSCCMLNLDNDVDRCYLNNPPTSPKLRSSGPLGLMMGSSSS